MKDFAAIDFETANNERTSVCSVGVVIVRNGEIVDSFYSLIQPEPNYYNFWCTQVHGISRRDTEDTPVFPKVWKQIEPLIEGLPLVAHNKAFDESCLKSVFRCYQMDYPDYPFFCTLNASRQVLPDLENHQLHTVATACGYKLENHHHALADAEACAWIAREIFKYGQFMNKEKHISYNTLLDELFKTWHSEMVKIEKGEFNFTKDGLLYKNDKTIEQTESEWQHSTKRVLFLLKDQNQKEEVKWDEDICYWLKDRDSDRPQDLENKRKNRELANSFVKCLAYQLWGIIKADIDNDWWYEEVEMHHEDVVELFNTLPFAFVECKKIPGGGSLRPSILKRHLRDYGSFLKQEIEILNPNIIVCTSQQSYDFVLKMYPNELIGLDGNKNFRYHPEKQLLVIYSLHPSARKKVKVIYDNFMNDYRQYVRHQSELSKIIK